MSSKFNDCLRDIISSIHDNCEINNDINICILIRKEITKTIYDLWYKQLQLIKSTNNYIKYHKEYVDDVTYIIADDALTIDHILLWSGLFRWRLDKQLIILKKDFIIDSIKQHKLLFDSINDYYHDIMLFNTTTITTNTIAENATIKRHYNINSGCACITTGTESIIPSNNQHIIKFLSELQGIYELLNDNFRSISYKRCCGLLSKLSPINTIDDLNNIKDTLKGIGKSIYDKIAEIITTKQLLKLQYFKNDSKIQSLLELTKIWGVGITTAHSLYNQGFKSISDLRNNHGINKLSIQQRIGLKYYEELQQRIPRSEMDEIGELVFKIANSLFHDIDIVICGSYRRGKTSSGDIDFLLSPKTDDHIPNVISTLVKSLSSIGLITDHLTTPEGIILNNNSSDDDDDLVINKLSNKKRKLYEDVINYQANTTSLALSSMNHYGVSTYMGICKLSKDDSIHRRIDIKYYPKKLFPFALLYFTGSDHFNRSMRLYASKQGYSLNDKGIIKCIRDNKRNKISSGSFIPCDTEKDIFDLLGIPYKEPTDRNCFDLKK